MGTVGLVRPVAGREALDDFLRGGFFAGDLDFFLDVAMMRDCP